MLDWLRRRGARKTPKRLRALHFRTVGPWLYLGGFQGNLGLAVGGESAAGRTSAARCPRHGFAGPCQRQRKKARRGYREPNGNRANARGSLASQGARGFEAGAERPRGWCSYVVVSLQISAGGSAQRIPSPQRIRPERARGDAVNGGQAFGCINRASKSRPWWRAPRTKLFAAKLRVAERAEGDKESRNRVAGCATPRGAAWGQLGSHGAKSVGGPRARDRVRNRRSRGRKKSSASLVEGRRPGSGKISSGHAGGVEAISAGFTGSEERAPRKCAAPAPSEVRDRGVRGSVTRSRGPGNTKPWQREEHTPTKVARFAEAIGAP